MEGSEEVPRVPRGSGRFKVPRFKVQGSRFRGFRGSGGSRFSSVRAESVVRWSMIRQFG
jgi:hypothetical protein